MGNGNICWGCMYLDRNMSQKKKGIFGNVDYYFCKAFKIWRKGEQNACDGYVGGQKCFLTSACVEYRDLADDCRELTALRAFRDGPLSDMEGGKELIEEYYRIAPVIVEKINSSEKAEEYYSYIYGIITECLKQLENEDYKATRDLYLEMVKTLAGKFEVK